VLQARFDRIFTRKTGFVTLDRLLARLNANKPELLMMLDRPSMAISSSLSTAENMDFVFVRTYSLHIGTAIWNWGDIR